MPDGRTTLRPDDRAPAPLMPPPPRGTVVRKKTARGTTFALRVPWQGRKVWVPLGGSWEGWTNERAEAERDLVGQLIDRGEWVPQQSQQKTARQPAVPTAQTFAVVASNWLHGRRKRLKSPKSVSDLEWRLGVAIQHLGDYPAADITSGTIDDMVTALLTEREEIQAAAAAGQPLTESYTDSRTGKSHERKRRGLSNGSINKVVDVTRRVLEDARKRKIIDEQPVTGDSRVRAERPARSYLEPCQAIALLDAAQALEEDRRGLTWQDVQEIRASNVSAVKLAKHYGVSDTLIGKIRRRELWTEKPERRRNDTPKLLPIALLLLAGPRIAELCALHGRHADLPARRLLIPRDATKTDAGERAVPLLPRAHEALVAHRAEYASGPAAPLYPTRDGAAQRPDNVRTKVLEPIVKKANELLSEREQPTIEHCTPHTLRRTFASILAEVGVPPRRAMALMGHTDARFTMSVYQQVLDMGDGAVEDLEKLLGCTLDDAFLVLSGRELGRPATVRSHTDRTLTTPQRRGRRR